MPRRKPTPPIPLPKRVSDWAKAGLVGRGNDRLPDASANLPAMLANWLDWFGKTSTKRPEDMFCFIYYDIENNKIRRLVARLLEKQGCVRVQKSVFFARIHRRRYHELTDLLRQIQQLYENTDSIMLLPVGEDMLNSLQVIGKSFDLEGLTAPRNTIFI